MNGAELSWGETDGAANESDRHRKKLRSAKSAARKEEAERLRCYRTRTH